MHLHQDMWKLALCVISLHIGFSDGLLGIGSSQSVDVQGTLTCNGQPASVSAKAPKIAHQRSKRGERKITSKFAESAREKSFKKSKPFKEVYKQNVRLLQ